MFAKIMQIVFKSLLVAPKVTVDVAGAITKIKSDQTVVAKIHDGLDAAIVALDAIAPIL